jgi:hypothetical protein
MLKRSSIVTDPTELQRYYSDLERLAMRVAVDAAVPSVRAAQPGGAACVALAGRPT